MHCSSYRSTKDARGLIIFVLSRRKVWNLPIDLHALRTLSHMLWLLEIPGTWIFTSICSATALRSTHYVRIISNISALRNCSQNNSIVWIRLILLQMWILSNWKCFFLVYIYVCGTSDIIRTAKIWYIADAHRVTGKFFSVEVLIAWIVSPPLLQTNHRINC